MKEAVSTSETTALKTATRRNIPEDAFLHNHRRENLKSYTMFILEERVTQIACCLLNLPKLQEYPG
jgi:hypothetical protein